MPLQIPASVSAEQWGLHPSCICSDILAPVLCQALCQLGEQQGLGRWRACFLREQELARTPERHTTGGSLQSWREALPGGQAWFEPV